jgi:hypothetical protein
MRAVFARLVVVSALALAFCVGVRCQTPGTLNLTIRQGADFSITLALKGPDGQPVDLTGYSVAAQVRKTPATTTPTATFTCGIPSPTQGLISVSLSHDTTAALTAPDVGYWDLFLTAPGGTRLCLVAGSVTVSPSITR